MGGESTVRQCGCGTRLSRSNKGSLCSACTKKAQAAVLERPMVPAEFWQTSQMQDALATRRMGVVIRAFRTHPFHPRVIPQTAVAGWAHVSQNRLSEFENGAEIHDPDRLAHWAQVLGMPADLYWFVPSNRALPVSAHWAPENETLLSPGSVGFEWFSDSGSWAAQPVVRVGLVEVEIIRDMTATYRGIDNRFGGGRARQLVSEFLTASVLPWLRADCARGMKDDLLTSAAELSHLAGWTSYDVGDRLAGGRHLRQAIRMAKQAGDRARVAEMLAGLAHQAAHARAGKTAVELAKAAQNTAHRSGVRAVVAEAALMAAHGYAVERDVAASLAALREAEAIYSASLNEERPDWLGYFDDAYLAAKTAHILYQLGDFSAAEEFARESLRMVDGYDRGKVFNTCLLASILAARGACAEAVLLTDEAMTSAGRITSQRTRGYLEDVATRLQPHRSHQAVEELLERMRRAGVASG
jgi:transcriptional regulator with XRE-family HTH domain